MKISENDFPASEDVPEAASDLHFQILQPRNFCSIFKHFAPLRGWDDFYTRWTNKSKHNLEYKLILIVDYKSNLKKKKPVFGSVLFL